MVAGNPICGLFSLPGTSCSMSQSSLKSDAAVRTFQLLDFQLGWCAPLPKMARLIWLFLNLESANGVWFLN